MQVTYYIPIYQWGDSPDGVHGGAHGGSLYQELKDLYGFEPDAVGHFEVTGTLPTENEFRTEVQTRSGAV